MTRKTRRPRVVIADDDPNVLAAFGRLLRGACKVVGSVRTGHGAVEAVNRVRPGVLVVDLQMSDVDGVEVCRQVKEVLPEAIVIVVTVFDDPEIQIRALREGAAAFMSKMWVGSALAPTIQRLFAEKQRRSGPSA